MPAADIWTERSKEGEGEDRDFKNEGIQGDVFPFF